VPVLHNLRVTLEMIKWEHSVFALPFALCGAMLAAGGLPTAHQILWIVAAMVAARSAAMAFNRLADASIDAANPRTRTRALPAGQLTPPFVATFVLVTSAVFVIAASQLNRLALWLSPVALAIVLLYSYTKRVTRWSHLVLGFALGIARPANSASHCRRYFLGGRVRHPLCLPGF
jgi:4-hydroxybenzoate polyprenyltransferase